MSNVATGLPVVFYTYVTPGVEPPQPEEGETWFDTSANESKVYDGAGWTVQNIESHGALSGINPDDHHTRYSDSEAESAAPVQSVNGQVGDVGGLATDSELSSHATRTDNPHDVTDDQTGAASALSSHESDDDAHHSRAVVHPTYPDLASVPNLSPGEAVFVESESALYVEDGT